MENKEKQKKFFESMSGAFQKATDISKKAVDEVQKGAKVLSEKAKNDNLARRIKKYNPIFPDTFYSESFHLPNMIAIADDAVRRDIDVCEGAIGWLSMEKDIEVLHLYDEEIKNSGICFLPHADSNAIYYVDKFDRNKFIRVDCIFGRAHDERLAELKYIAHSLGAKSCSIETEESSIEKKSIQSSVNQAIGKYASSVSNAASSEKGENRCGRVIAEFEGNNTPKRPKLKWFANDENIKRLIEMRCTNRNSIKSEELKLEGASSAVMSQTTATAISYAIGKIGFKINLDLERLAKEEHTSKLYFKIEF